MQDIFSDTCYLARHPIKAGEIVDVHQHQPLRRFQYIYAVEIKTEHLPHTARQLEHLAIHRHLLLLHPAMQWRTFDNRMHLLACDIELDIVSCVLDAVLRQVVAGFVKLQLRHLFRCAHQVNIL